MKKQLLMAVFLLIASIGRSQIPALTVEPDGGNRKASVSEQIGVVKIVIDYNRPGVKGREGKIYNTAVAHYGFRDLGHGTGYAVPWRAGANENTTMSFSYPVKIDGQDLPAGKYGFFIALGETESTIVFNKVNNSWGSFYYDETQDALRVTVKNEALDRSVEWLTYDFTEQTDDGVTIAMSWEKRRIPFHVTTDRKKWQIEAFRSDFRSTRIYYDFMQAANWCVENNYELDQALAWIDRGIYFRVMGEKNFRSLQVKAAVLRKMNRAEEAKKIMDEALPLGTVLDVHFYARGLLNEKQPQDAFKAFKLNYDKNPGEFTTQLGMARGYSGIGEYKKAIPFLKMALPKAPDDFQKNNIPVMIKKLEEGKDINTN